MTLQFEESNWVTAARARFIRIHISRVLFVVAGLFCATGLRAAQPSVADGTALLERGYPLKAAALWNEIIASGDNASAAEAERKLEQNATILERAFKDNIDSPSIPILTLLTKAFPRRPEPHLKLAVFSKGWDVQVTIDHLAEAVNHGVTSQNLLEWSLLGGPWGDPAEQATFETFLSDSFGPEFVARLKKQFHEDHPPVTLVINPPAEDTGLSEADADKQLNTAYIALRKSLSEPAKQELKREQVEWLKRRDAINDPAARLRLIHERTAEFERRLGRGQ